MRGTILGALVLVAVWPIDVQAQSYRQLSLWCYGQSTDAETVQGCDAVIRWSRETPRDTGTAFYNRGITHRNQGCLDRAIALQPGDPDALLGRGLAHHGKGDVAGGDADIAAAKAGKAALSDAVARSGVK